MNSFVIFFIFIPVILIIYEIVNKFLFQDSKPNNTKNHPNNHRVITNQNYKNQQSTMKSSIKTDPKLEISQPLTDDYLLPVLEELKNEGIIRIDLLVGLITQKMNLTNETINASFRMDRLQEYTSKRFNGLFDSFAREINLSSIYLVRSLDKEHFFPVYYARILESIAYMKEAGYVLIEFPKRASDGKFINQSNIPSVLITKNGINLLSSHPLTFNCNYLFNIIDSKKPIKSDRNNSDLKDFYRDLNELNDEIALRNSPWNDVPSVNDLFNEDDIDL